MNEKTFNEIFALNLTGFLEQNDKTQLDLAKHLGVSTASVSNWCKGIKTPRMNKVDAICRYFDIQRSDLMEYNGPANASARLAEKRLLAYFNALNDAGKNKALDYTADLIHNTLYSTEPLLNAAHERTDIDVTDEMRKHDDDIMDEEDF